MTSECKICGAPAHLKHRGQPGYMAPATFDVYECGVCDASFVTPLAVDGRVYDTIYTHAERLLGYGRYAFYARRVARSKTPLRYLAAQEDTYYPIADLLGPARATQRRRVLEVGTGLGYLTYALVRAGWDAVGLDISTESIGRARARYGDHYVAGDLATFAREHAGEFDAVIATEVIEHVPDPVAMLRDLKAALAPGGRAILTTPNKTFYPAGVVWETEAPPVHLWWLSESSMRFLGSRAELETRVFDYRALNARDTTLGRPVPNGRVTRKHMMDADGRPLARESTLWRTYRNLDLPRVQRRVAALVAEPLRRVVEVFGAPPATAFARRRTLCVVYTKA
jgi:SAM-dependent methyltransferase